MLLALAAAPAAAMLAPPDCGSRLPQVLNVGLPFSGGDEIDIDDVQRRLQRAAENLYGPLSLCAERPLQVNGVLGSDYQILDWMSRELIDVAVVPALSLHVLERDGLDLLELPDPPDRNRGWLASRTPAIASFDVAPDDTRQARTGDEASADLGAARGALLARARERAGRAQAQQTPPARLPIRLVFTSHLSTAGFLVPVAQLHGWLESALGGVADEEERAALRAAFWEELFAHACFDFGAPVERGPSCRELETDRVAAPAGGALREIRFVGVPVEPPPDAAPHAVLAFGAPVRDRLVILRARAGAIFQAARFSAARAELPAELVPLFGAAPAVAGEEPLAEAFASHLQREPYYGTRPFAFTVDESLRLLALHQRLATTGGLALVLPGGGVKAAYQSRLIDRLYGSRLVNGAGIEASGEAGGDAAAPLGVSHVIGTSGGALLGYFVARLGAQGPHDLSRILWYREPPGGGEEVPLDSADVFGWTDMPRYASLLAIFLVFAVGLTIVSLGPSRWLGPAETSIAQAPRGVRLGLILPLAAVLAATPVLVQTIGRELELSVEHVPEFEGLLYAVLMVVAMFADQCLVRTGEATSGAPRPSARVGTWGIALGLALMLAPALAARAGSSHALLERRVSFGGVYLALVAATLALLVATTRRRRGTVLAHAVWITVAGLAAGTAVAFAVLAWMAGTMSGVLARLDRVPLLFVALVATVAIVLVTRAVRGAMGASGWLARLQERGGALAGRPAVRAAVGFLAPFLTCLLLVDLTRPAAVVARDASLGAMLGAPSKLDLPLGALAVCVGALVVLLGLVVRLQARAWGYRIERETEFVDAALLVIAGLALAVYFTLWAASALAPGRFTLFELTTDFWKGLWWASALLSLALLVWALWRRLRGPEALRAAVVFLCSRHPHGHLVSRRYARMLLVAASCYLWWNLLLAPGLYGNRYASAYLDETAKRFDEELGAGSAAGLTAPLLATANALETDGARYVLIVPGGEPCPLIREPAGSGGRWRTFHAVAGGRHAEDEAPGAQGDGGPECTDLHLPRDGELMRRFVFASGSPFPIFPAHRVEWGREADAEREALVDGGYSSNTPVEAASRLGTERVLIVNSSYPLKADCGGGGGWTRWVGPLASNAARLPGFLFERAQQLDRRSRANLFVVSLSPRPRCDWPGLSNFRRSVVERMIREADADLGLRIGMVESWGPPRFQVSAQVGGLRAGSRGAAAPEGGSDGPASAADRPPPARARAR